MLTVSTNHVYTGFAFIGFFLVVTLLPLHIKARNIGTCAFIFWMGLLCFNGFINSILWDNNDSNLAPVWCDISSRISIAGPISVSAASLCIAHRLYTATKVVSIYDLDGTEYNAKRRRANLCDFFLVVGIPVIHVVVSYVVQIKRFVIYENIGCRAAVLNMQLTYPLLLMWPVILSLAVASYAGVIIYKLKRQRARIQMLGQHNGYIRRFLALIMVIFVCSFPPSLASILLDATVTPIYDWPGWNEAHVQITEVAKIPYSVLERNGDILVALEYSRWIYVVYTMIFFAFFGFTTEAKRFYRSVFIHVIPEALVSSLKTRVIRTDHSTAFSLSSLATDQSHACHISHPNHAPPLSHTIQKTCSSDDLYFSGISSMPVESNTRLAEKSYIAQPSSVHDITLVVARSPPHSPSPG